MLQYNKVCQVNMLQTIDNPKITQLLPCPAPGSQYPHKLERRSQRVWNGVSWNRRLIHCELEHSRTCWAELDVLVCPNWRHDWSSYEYTWHTCMYGCRAIMKSINTVSTYRGGNINLDAVSIVERLFSSWILKMYLGGQ